MTTIVRQTYINKVKPFINKQLIKVFTGQRRIGKSSLLIQIKDEIIKLNASANIIYIDFEKIEFISLKNYLLLNDYVNSKSTSEMNYLFIDEVQEVAGFELLLRSLLSDGNYDIYCTGSNAKLLSGDLATHLSGRQIEIEVHSLSFTEYLDFHKKTASQEILENYLLTGGLPYLIHLPDDYEIISEYLHNIYSTILFRDVVTRHEIRDVSFLENLILYLAGNTGSLISATRISKYLKSQQQDKTTASIINYINYLCNAYIINKVKRIDIQGRQIFESGEKYYFEDVGLRNRIAGSKLADIEKIMENAVYHHLMVCGYTVFVGNLGDKEIDFVAEKKSERIYIQVTYLMNNETTIEREFGNLLKINDNFPKYVVSYDSFVSQNTYSGVKHLRLLDFLQMEL